MNRTGILICSVVAAAAWVGIAGCESSKSNEPAKTAAQAKPKEAAQYTGREAYERTTGLALKWAQDSQPVRLESILTSEATGQGGKATIWRAFYASPSRKSLKSFTCSGSRLPDSPAYGVTTDPGENPYSPELASMAFSPFLFKVDSDKAYNLAQQHGGQAILAKDSKQPVTYVLLFDRKKNVPVWYVVYGKGDKDRKGVGVINATTGDFISAGK
ncbi:MAG: hypothetical protein JO187_03240 [Acidobacteria bacterium]|nr:hypothetical protein [Acidobacteriaceae bacterium]MBV9608550.1 hypothetical protein [Acidobacteriota bacterium]